MTPRWRLFPKYALLIISLVGGLLIASGATSIYFSWRENEQNLIALQSEKAQSAAVRIEQYILDIEHQLGWTAQPAVDPGLSPLEPQRIEYLKLLRLVPALTEVAWLDPNGHEQVRISRLAMDLIGSDIDLSQEPKFKVAKGGTTYYGPVYFRKETEPYMTIARPAGSGGGVTAVEVNLKFVWEVVSRIRIGEKGLAYVVDAGGILIAHPDISLVLKKTDLNALPQVAALTHREPPAGPAARGIGGDPVLSAHAAISTLHWTVFVESPEAEAFAPLYASILRAGLLLGAGLLVSMVASFFVARALVRPLRELQEGAARIGAGELDRRIEVRTGDELEGLAEQFNQMAAALKESYAGLERKVVQRTAELTEALEQQTATAEILRVISSSPTDVQPVFDAIAKRARLLCAADSSAVRLPEGESLRVRARDLSETALALRTGSLDVVPIRLTSVTGRAFLEGRAIHIEDVQTQAEADYPDAHATAKRNDFRTVLVVPMLRNGRSIGTLSLFRYTMRPFSATEIGLVKTFADQAVIAIENVRLFNETREALERQTATADVLQAISNSVADTAPVFDRILAACERLFNGKGVVVFVIDEEGRLAIGAIHGPDPERLERTRRIFPVPLAGTATEQALRERRLVTYGDVLHDPDVPDGLRRIAAHFGESYSVAIAPMLWEGRAIGSIMVDRPELRAFDETEQRLLRTFADQAVIAIQNARLFNETKEALDRQTATADILRVIAGSPADVTPVLEAIVQSAARLFGRRAAIRLVEDGLLRRKAISDVVPGGFDGAEAQPIDANSLVGAVALARKAMQVEDTRSSGAPAYARENADRLVFRSIASAPLLREDTVLGVLSVSSPEVGKLSEKQMAMLATFADQAVIAIENVRLFNETKEALEQQTATAEVLQVISSSVADAKPVFDKILDSCERLFAATGLGIYLVDDAGMLHSGGFRAATADTVDLVRSAAGEFPRRLEGTATEIALRDRRVVHFPDVLADVGVPAPLRKVAAANGSFSIAFAPMLWEARGVGVIQVSRNPPQPFTDKELTLLKTFADQAVIAIQNARLFNETQQALEQQTATAEILRVISGSVTDTQPVFDAIVQSCRRLFGGKTVAMVMARDDMIEPAAFASGDAAQHADVLKPWPLDRGSGAGTCILESRPIVVVDTDEAVDRFPRMPQLATALGYRSCLFVPLLREGRAIGCLAILRAATGTFDDQEIALAQTFADQAVIAIENVRLFNETKEALEQQKASAEILSVISSSVADTAPVFEKILDSCKHLFGSDETAVLLVDDQGQVDLGAYLGKARDAVAATFPAPLAKSPAARAIGERRVAHYPDVRNDASVTRAVRKVAELAGYQSMAYAPMMWDDKGIGAIGVSRAQGAFTDKELALLQTFADQAVIAIQNARLFGEIQAKSRELELANKHKSEFLANMSHELRTPLNAIIGFSEVLSEKMFGEVNAKQLEYLLDIHSSGHHLLSLINDILDLSKIEAGRMELDLANVNLPMLLDNCTTLVRERASRQGLVLTLEVGNGVGEWVADVRKVKQVVINLLSNAVKFTPAGGHVILRARQLEHAVEIAVIDTGVGIAKDQQALVFEEFRQAGGDYLRKSEGTGLGLSLSKRFVQLHGGSIRVESEPGRGSTFAFVLPQRVVEAV